MNRESETIRGPMSDVTRQRLEDVRRGLLQLHKVLLEGERGSYEQVYGRVSSGGELLQLVIHHPWFAWLRPISEMVVLIDERLEEGEEPSTEQDAAALFAQVRALLRPAAEGSDDAGFRERYQRALQQDPASVLAHAGVMRLLPPPDLPAR